MYQVSEYYRSKVQSVDEGDAVDVRVGVGGLLLEILVAGNDLGEVDGGGSEREPEVEGENDEDFGRHGLYFTDVEKGLRGADQVKLDGKETKSEKRC